MIFINIEGVDGVGKTTLAGNMKSMLESMGLRVLFFSKKDMLLSNDIDDRLGEFRKLIWFSNKNNSHSISQYHRFLTIAAMYELVTPTLKNMITQKVYDFIITDGWYFRHIAKTSLRTELDVVFLSGILKHVLVPDLTLFLDLQPEFIWSRRDRWEEHEIGRWDGYSGDEKQNFIAYQIEVSNKLKSLLAGNWTILDVQDKDQETVTRLALNELAIRFNL